MKYTIISREELIKLIKFGTIYQSINYIFDEKNKDLKIEELLKALPYDDELGFVIVKFTYNESSAFDSIKTLIELDIKDIINIFCLSNQALEFYKTKFNPNIKFKLFENLKLIENINKYKVIEDKKKGVKALAEIFKLELKNNQGKLDEEYIQELLNYKEIGYLNQDFRSFYHDIFCYERKNSFFKEDVGFLSDVTALNKMQDIRTNKEIFLSGNFDIKLGNPSDKDKKIKELVDNTLNKLPDNEKKDELIKKILIGTIFLKSKSLLDSEKREINYWDEFLNLIHEFKNDYFEETKIALWYIGVFLGYKYLYDDYYKQLDLNIFQENNVSKIGESIVEETSPLELELEKMVKENKELKEKVQVLEKQLESNENYESKNSEETQALNHEQTSSQEDDKNSSSVNNIKEFLNKLAIESLWELYFRPNSHKLKLQKDIKDKYNTDNKEELIEKILTISLL
ncbi:MAG: hypothetical protein EOL93_00945 [Epsilonproteobacteria bacterium]|nr:hypothetical protein [Campylobacterota bacterium]